MRRLRTYLKRAAAVTAALALSLGSVVVIVLKSDAGQRWLCGYIEEYVRSEYGAELRIGGIEPSLLPVGVAVESVVLDGADGHVTEPVPPFPLSVIVVVPPGDVAIGMIRYEQPRRRGARHFRRVVGPIVAVECRRRRHSLGRRVASQRNHRSRNMCGVVVQARRTVALHGASRQLLMRYANASTVPDSQQYSAARQ